MSRDMKALAIALLFLTGTALVYAAWADRAGGNPWLFYGSMALCLALAFSARGLTGWHERSRTSALEKAARGLRFEFDPDGRTLRTKGPWPQPEPAMDMRYVNLMRGAMDGRPLVLCDFVYGTGFGRSRRVCRQTLAAVNLGGWCLPRFVMRPEGLTDKVSAFFGDDGEDIDFQDSARFSGSYYLSGEDRPAVRRVFTEGVLAYFAERPGWFVEGEPSGWMVLFRHDTLLEPYELKGLLEELGRLTQLFRPPRTTGPSS